MVCAMLGTPVASADLIIHHIDVDMGDATLIIDTTTRRTLLVDAGNRSYGLKAVAPLIKKLGYSKVDYFVATHYDSDHIGGLDEVVQAGVTFDVIYDRGDFTHRKTITDKGNTTQYGEYVDKAGAARTTLSPECGGSDQGEPPAITLGPDTMVEVVAVGGKYLRADCAEDTALSRDRESNKKKDNALSIALVIRNKQFSYFIGGDLTGGGLRKPDIETLIAHKVGDVDVLKLNHHGSETSSNQLFLEALRPEVAIVSVGDGGVNRQYRLPRQTVLDRLAALSSRPILYLTHQGNGGALDNQHVVNGNISVYSDGMSYTVNGKTFCVDERLPECQEF